MVATIQGVLLAVFAIITAIYGFRYYEGAKPALLPAPADIARMEGLNEAKSTGLPLTIEPGFGIEIFVSGLAGTREMVLDPSGRLAVSTPSNGKILLFEKYGNHGHTATPTTLLDGLDKPHGLAFYCDEGIAECRLYVGETTAVKVYDYDIAAGKATNGRKIVDLPAGGNHITRTLKIQQTDLGPKLLISVGSSCNVCKEADWRRAKILSADLDGKNLRDYATGLRNSVFMTDNPLTGELWATDMGRDLLGDDLPPDEVNIIQEGKDYGWPYCYGKQVQDKRFDASKAAAERCDKSVPSKIDLPAHSAPLGLAFASGQGWASGYHGSLFVAYHGSWNRSVPTGYKVVRFDFDARGEVGSVRDFVSGWLTSDGALGRPTGLLALPNGTLYIADDKAGVIYKVTQQPQ